MSAEEKVGPGPKSKGRRQRHIYIDKQMDTYFELRRVNGDGPKSFSDLVNRLLAEERARIEDRRNCPEEAEIEIQTREESEAEERSVIEEFLA